MVPRSLVSLPGLSRRMKLDTLELLLGLVTIESLHLPHREQRVRYVPIWDKGVCT